MSSIDLHIVSFDVPSPPDYGGVIDVYFKLRALHQEGIRIHLHCFQYGRPTADILNSICTKVSYYPRNTSVTALFSALPFIVATRKSKELLEALSSDNTPVLFEGLHSCAYLGHASLKNKTKIVRTHNIEHDYYAALGKVERSFFRRLYFKREADKLRRFEGQLKFADHILAISPADANQLASRYSGVQHVMAFHPNENVTSREGSGDFALYHGNLEVGENNEAALFLVNEVFSGLKQKLVIAGNKPSAELKSAASQYSNIEIRAGISTSEIDALISSAHINVLPTFQATGIKLKLLAALFKGRHCIANTPMVANTGLESACIISDTAASMKSEIERVFQVSFSSGEIAKRTDILGERFSNKLNAEKIIKLLR
jgi:hypothetical protein